VPSSSAESATTVSTPGSPPAPAEQPAWWRDAVFYEIYLRSFADGNGDGVGDLAGVRARLPYLRDLGVDALWLSPFYPSPMVDHGYDVADPRDVEPVFGDLAEFDRLLADAHRLGMRMTIDVVPNHSSDQRRWFRAALAAAPGSPERARYVFRDGSGPGGAEPPNNWPSVFGGPAWQRVPDGQWYLHLFAPEQPDLNWRNPEVAEDAEDTLRFWLDRGVDGFRIDVAMGLFKDPELGDLPTPYTADRRGHGPEDGVLWNRPEVHDVYRSWRQVLDSYPGHRMAVGEVWVRDPGELAAYIRPDELHLAFNFRLLRAEWAAAEMRAVISQTLAACAAVGAPTTWVLSSHDAVRHLSRYGGGDLGRRRARAAALLLLGLPGPVYLYQGEELALPEVDLPDDALQDPVWERSGHTERGRDGCRVPLPWSGGEPPYGFSPTSVRTWLPQPTDWGTLTAQAQDRDGDSMLGLYRRALRARRELGGSDFRWLEGPPDALIWRRGDVVCALNFGAAALRLPPGEVLLTSEGLEEGRLPTDSAAWVRSAPAAP
jgi:alpha-glucosidase